MHFPVDHIGVAVTNMDEAIALYKKRFNMELETRETLEERHLELAFLTVDNTSIELLAPLSGESTITKFLESRGSGIHHICYEVDDIRAELKRLKDQGVELLDQEPRPGARGAIIAFLHPKDTGGVLTELCEYPHGKK